jgi:protein SCO1/2
MKSLSLLSLLSVAGVLSLSACRPQSQKEAVVAGSGSVPTDRLSRLWKRPEFDFLDQDGTPFSASQMDGKVWVVDFFYTTCPGPCPALTSRLGDLHRRFAANHGVAFLSISSNPEKDRPEVLKLYADKFGADARWRFLTGDKAQIFSVANQGFKMGLTEGAADGEPVTHSTRLLLVDAEGWVRGFYEGVGEGVEDASNRLIADIETLTKGAK